MKLNQWLPAKTAVVAVVADIAVVAVEDSAEDEVVEEDGEDSEEEDETIAVDVAVVLTGATTVVMTVEEEIGKCYTRITIHHPEEPPGDVFMDR